jgi:hypothetical protein
VALLPGLALLALAVALGGVAAFWHEHARGAIAPLRVFAIAAAVSIALLHLLPEAVAEGGYFVLGAAAFGLLAPALLERAILPQHSHRHGAPAVALAMGYAAVMAHQVGEGAVLASLAETGGLSMSIVLTIAAHTTPLAMVVGMRVLELREGQGARRAAALALAGVLGATLLGAFVGTLLEADVLDVAGPWLLATIAGLLLHTLLHDAFPRPKGGTASRLVHAAAGWLGLGIALTGVEHGGEHGGWVEGLGATLRVGGIAILALAILVLSLVAAPAADEPATGPHHPH